MTNNKFAAVPARCAALAITAVKGASRGGMAATFTLAASALVNDRKADASVPDAIVTQKQLFKAIEVAVVGTHGISLATFKRAKDRAQELLSNYKNVMLDAMGTVTANDATVPDYVEAIVKHLATVYGSEKALDAATAKAAPAERTDKQKEEARYAGLVNAVNKLENPDLLAAIAKLAQTRAVARTKITAGDNDAAAIVAEASKEAALLVTSILASFCGAGVAEVTEEAEPDNVVTLDIAA